MPRTVVYFTDSDGFGGAEQALLTLAAGIDRRRWHPVLVFHPGPGTRTLQRAARTMDIGLRAVPRVEGRLAALGVAQLTRTLRAIGPAVFHAHLNWPLACRFGLAAAILAGVPAIIATEHSFVEIPWRRSRLAQRALATGIDRYVAVSEDLARRLRQGLGFPAHKIEVVHNGIALHLFDRRPHPDLRGAWTGGHPRPVVLAIARLHPQKGVHYLLEAAALVPQAIIVVAGDGPQRGALEAEAQRLGLGDRTIFLGYRQDVGDLLASCDLFVLPSDFEGLPLTVLEAMAAAKPVVATDVGGTGEAVVDGETGLLVPPRDPVALARALQTLLVNPELRARFGAAGKARAIQEFSAETMIRRVTELYEAVLDSHRPAHGRD